MYSRVPSKRVAMVSKKVFCGAISPRITGMRERVEPRLSRRSEPWPSAAAVDTKPGRNRDVVPGAPPKPWRRAPSRDARDSTVQRRPTTAQVIPAERRREEPLEAGGERTEGRRHRGEGGHIYARVCCNAIRLPPLPFPSLSLSLPLSCTNTYFSPSLSIRSFPFFCFLCQPLSVSLKCVSLSTSPPLMLW